MAVHCVFACAIQFYLAPFSLIETLNSFLLEPAGIFRILIRSRSVAIHIRRPGRKWKRALLVVKRQEQADLIIIHCQLTTQLKQLGVRLPG